MKGKKMNVPSSSLKNSGPVKIVKVPVEESGGGEGHKSSQASFSTMPQLYLELLENKEKIKQGLVNREYDPDDTMSDISYFQNMGRQPSQQQRPGSTMGEIQEQEDEILSSSSESFDQRSGKDDDDLEDEDDEDQSIPPPRQSYQPLPVSKVEEDRNNEDEDDDLEEEDEEEDDEELMSDSSLLTDPYRSSRPVAAAPVRESPPADMPEAYDKMLAPRPTAPAPPRLADLKKTGEYVDTGKSHTPDLHRIYSKSSQEEEEIKREILFKFEILKKSYRNIDIPNFTIHTDLVTLSRSYENTLRRVSLDTNVESYKQYLIGGFMLVEFVVSNWMGLDMQGFTQQQMLNMIQYERLLIELGERSYVPGGKSWPVEVRLLGMILMNAGIFIISKIILKKTGNNVMNMMNAFQQPAKVAGGGAAAASTGGPTVPSTTTPGSSEDPSKGRRRMRGPMIDPDDIPDLGSSSIMS
jgi:hypothetical protein